MYDLPALQIPLFAALTIGLASYSWHRFEKPILSLKRKFPYPKTNPPKMIVTPRADRGQEAIIEPQHQSRT